MVKVEKAWSLFLRSKYPLLELKVLQSCWVAINQTAECLSDFFEMVTLSKLIILTSQVKISDRRRGLLCHLTNTENLKKLLIKLPLRNILVAMINELTLQTVCVACKAGIIRLSWDDLRCSRSENEGSTWMCHNEVAFRNLWEYSFSTHPGTISSLPWESKCLVISICNYRGGNFRSTLPGCYFGGRKHHGCVLDWWALKLLLSQFL